MRPHMMSSQTDWHYHLPCSKCNTLIMNTLVMTWVQEYAIWTNSNKLNSIISIVLNEWEFSGYQHWNFPLKILPSKGSRTGYLKAMTLILLLAISVLIFLQTILQTIMLAECPCCQHLISEMVASVCRSFTVMGLRQATHSLCSCFWRQ